MRFAIVAACLLLAPAAQAQICGGNYGICELVHNGSAITQTGNITCSNANGPYWECAASSATNPTLVPDRASLTAGIGGTGGDVSIITSGSERINVDTAGSVTANSSWFFQANSRVIDGNGSGGGASLSFGTSDDFVLRYSTTQTPDTMSLSVGADSRAVVVHEGADGSTDFAHALATHPTIFIQTADATAVTQYTGYRGVGTQTELFKTLTESAATSVVQIPVASGAATAGVFWYTVYAADATNHQSRSGRTIFSAVNEAGTETCALGTLEELDNTPTGTLTAAVTCSTSPTNAVDIQINAVSDRTQTTLRAYYTVQLMGPGEPLPQ